MVREMQHYVPFRYYVCDPALNQCRVIKRFPSLGFMPENFFREIHKMPEIMDASTWYYVIPFSKIDFANEEFEKTRIHFFIIDKTHRFAFSSVFQAFFDLLYKTCSNIIIDIYFRIPGYFKYSRLILIITKIAEYF